MTGRKGTSIHTDPETGATTQVNITVGERCTQDCANRDVFRPAGSTDTYEYINHGPVSGEGALPGGDAQGDGADPTAPGESSGESSPTTEGEGSLIGLGTTREHGGGQDGGGGDGGTGKFRRVSELSRLGDAFDFGVKGGLGIHAAMMLESLPDAIGLLGGTGSGLMQQLAQQALDRSGVVNQMRSWSVEQYRQGTAISPAATNAGVMAGVGGAVLVDVLIPGVGVEMSMAARAQRAVFEPATNVSQQVLRQATGALGRADDQIHHIMTNKNWVSDATGGPWSPRFTEMASRAGMTLDDAANKVVVAGHKGPHSQAYHEAVYRTLSDATTGLSGGEYTKAFQSSLAHLRTEVSTPGTWLNRMVTR